MCVCLGFSSSFICGKSWHTSNSTKKTRRSQCGGFLSKIHEGASCRDFVPSRFTRFRCNIDNMFSRDPPKAPDGQNLRRLLRVRKPTNTNRRNRMKSDELEWISDDFGSNDQNQVRLRYTIIITDRCTVVLTWFNIFNSIFRLPELWEMSGPPISDGDAATCSGVLTLGSGAHQHDASHMISTWQSRINTRIWCIEGRIQLYQIWTPPVLSTQAKVRLDVKCSVQTPEVGKGWNHFHRSHYKKKVRHVPPRKKVFIHCDTVNDLVTNFLFTKLDPCAFQDCVWNRKS